jgi:hypothetical protein
MCKIGVFHGGTHIEEFAYRRLLDCFWNIFDCTGLQQTAFVETRQQQPFIGFNFEVDPGQGQ